MNWDVAKGVPQDAPVLAGDLVELRVGAAWAAVQVMPKLDDRAKRFAGVVLATDGLRIQPGQFVSFERQQVAARIRS